MKPSQLLIIGAVVTACGASPMAKTITFAGYNWAVKSGGHIGPGPNSWDENNVWVDQHGYLHLALTYRNSQWYCSEVSMADRLGFGRYQFWVGSVASIGSIPTSCFGCLTIRHRNSGPE